MSKENAGGLASAIVALILIYVFWFTTEGKQIGFWGRVGIWLGASGAAYTIGYAIGKDEEPVPVTPAVQ